MKLILSYLEPAEGNAENLLDYNFENLTATKRLYTEKDKEEVFEAVFDSTMAKRLLEAEIERMKNVVWNCKNAIRYSQDDKRILEAETTRLGKSKETLQELEILCRTFD